MFEFNCKVDLARGVQKTIIRQVLATEDNLAHTFHIACTRNGAEEDLTGASVSGYFIRADGVTASLVGSVIGNIASVTLNNSCYKTEGRCHLIVKLTKDGTVSTIFWGEGCVSLSQTSTIIDDGEITLSLDELLAKITEYESRITVAESQAMASATAAANAEASATASAEAAVEAGNNAVAVKEACESATVAANEAAERANSAADSSAVLKRVEAVEEQVAENTEAIANKADASAVKPTLLWSGTDGAGWASGNITVAGIGDWQVLRVVTGVGSVLAFKGAQATQGIGVNCNESGNHRTIAVRYTVSGDVCTLSTAHYINHSNNGQHGARTDTEITEIYGLMKG